MSVAVLPRHHFATMPSASFKGDQDMLIDALINASRKREISDAQLKERALVPFQFDADLPMPSTAAKSFLEVPRRQRKASGTGSPTATIAIPQQHVQDQRATKRAGGTTQLGTSPPKKENERMQGRHQKPAAPSTSGTGGAKGRKHHRDPSVKSLPALAATASTERQASMSAPAGRASPPRKRVETNNGTSKPTPGSSGNRRKGDSPRELCGPSSGATTVALPQPVLAHSASASRFAGPTFTNSPTPDCLPLPTSSLLMAQAAEQLRATLQL